MFLHAVDHTFSLSITLIARFMGQHGPIWGRQDPGGPHVVPMNFAIGEVISISIYVCLFVCFITKSFLTYSFVSTSPALSTICRPFSTYVCSITPETAKVGSSYSHTRAPGVGCWFPDRSNCSHWSFQAAVLPINPNIYTDQWEPIVIYHYYFYWSLYNYAANAADMLTATTVVQGVDNHSWCLYCRRCYCICVCWSFQWDIAISTMTWPAKHNPNQGRQSTHRLHLYPLGDVFQSP